MAAEQKQHVGELVATFPSDGVIGVSTVSRLQLFLTAHGIRSGDIPDGKFGPICKKGLQKFLRKNVSKEDLKKHNTVSTVVDGVFGTISTKMLQIWLNTKLDKKNRLNVDGEFGKLTIRKLQDYLNLKELSVSLTRREKKITGLNMSLHLLFANTGGKQKGTYERTVKVSTGFKADFELGLEFEYASEASLGVKGPLKMLGVTGEVKTKMRAMLKANAKFSYDNHKQLNEKFVIDLSAPMYIYQLNITGKWGNEAFSGSGGFFITDEVIHEHD